MQTANIVVDQELARERLRQYRDAKAPKTERDIAIMRAYRQIAQGKIIIQAYESIRQAGFHVDGSPKLALIGATATSAGCTADRWGIEFRDARYGSWGKMHNRKRIRIDMDRDGAVRFEGRAIVPLIPAHVRPASNLGAYHILWEADWKVAPVDPMLLRKLSGDLWLVVAAWDLTDVERAVIAQ